MKENVLVYATTVEVARKLNKDQFYEFWTKYFDYVLKDVPFETDDLVIDIMFNSIKFNIDKALKNYQNCVRNGSKGAEYGKKGGRPKKEKTPTETPSDSNSINDTKPQEKPQEKPHNDNVNDNVNVKEKENVNDTMINHTSTCNDNNTFDNSFEENEKTFCDTGLTVPEGTEVVNNENEVSFEEKCYKCIDKFKSGIGLGLVPSKKQILGYMLDNKEGYYKSFIESYPIGDNGNRLIPNDDMKKHLFQIIQPMIQTYGYSIYEDDEVLDKFNRWFVKSRLGESYKIEII